MSENEESALIKLAVSVGKLEVKVDALDKKVDGLDSKMDAMTEREARGSGEKGAKKNILEKYIIPLLYPFLVGVILFWITKVNEGMIKALDAIAKGVKP